MLCDGYKWSFTQIQNAFESARTLYRQLGTHYIQTNRVTWDVKVVEYVIEGRLLLKVRHKLNITIAPQASSWLPYIPTCPHFRYPTTIVNMCKALIDATLRPWDSEAYDHFVGLHFTDLVLCNGYRWSLAKAHRRSSCWALTIEDLPSVFAEPRRNCFADSMFDQDSSL